MKKVSRVLLGVFFILAGVMHFVNPTFYLAMMPPFIPFHEFMVYFSGVIEILLGLAAALNFRPRSTGFALILLLIAVFPANIYMATNPDLFPDYEPIALLIRLPIQLLFFAWVYFALVKGTKNTFQRR